jgi:uncharacterized protein YjbI with pentapeptide repeats
VSEVNQRKIARINELSAIARTSWLALLGFLAYIGITLLAVEDADFFVPARQTQLPVVGIAIPTFSFFVFAPPLAAALYIYVHIHLLELWDALADAPNEIDGELLGERLHPWIANSYALTLKGRGTAMPAQRDRPLRRLGNAATVTLVWAAGPVVLAGFWWRSMPAHAEWLTLLIALSFFLALRAGLISLWHARARLLRPDNGDPWDGRWKAPLVWTLAILVALTSWLRTEAGLDHYANRLILLTRTTFGVNFIEDSSDPDGRWRPPWVVAEEWVDSRWWIPKLRWFSVPGQWPWDPYTWTPLAATDLANAQLVTLSPDWHPPETARLAFREIWCRHEGLTMAVCGPPPDRYTNPSLILLVERRAWCREHELADDTACADHFTARDHAFLAEWQQAREAALDTLPGLDLRRRDLRGVYAPRASLIRADLEEARLEEADLKWARLEGADLYQARMERADLHWARLEWADLPWASMESANLREARLEGADLQWARLEGAVLRRARLEGADLQWANLKSADWDGAHLHSPAHGADFRGGIGLTQEQLESVIGNEYTLLPHDPPLRVYTCWTNPPANLRVPREPRFMTNPDAPREALRPEWLCGPDNPRRQTGTPCPPDLRRQQCPEWAIEERLVEPD